MDLKINKKGLLGLVLVLVLASFFRLWHINSMPGGLYPDEAANGEDALLILQGQHTPFFERGLGREALYHYLLAVSIKFLGIGVSQIHIVSVAIGILTVLATWFLAKEMFNTKIAFIVTLLLASSTWHTVLSRTGFRAILLPLFATLFFHFGYLISKQSSQKKRLISAILSGACLALGFYTYISFRAMIGIIGLLIMMLLIANWRIFKKYKKEIIVGAISCLIVLIPLIRYFSKDPGAFMGRAGGVSIFNPDLNNGNVIGTALKVLNHTFFMFFTKGDLNWRHNVSGFSMLNPIVSSLFAFGFIYCSLIIIKKFLSIKTFKEKSFGNSLKYLFLMIWFLGMLVPELLTAESIPHALRAIGAIPAVFFFPAILIDLFENKMGLLKNKKFISIGMGMLLAVSVFYNYNLYFGISANSPDFYYAYRSDLTVVSNYLNNRNQKQETYLVLDEYSVQTPDFLTGANNRPYQLLDPALSYQVKLNPKEQIIFTQSTIFDAKKFAEYNPNAIIIKQEFNKFDQEIMRIYEYK